MPEQATSIVTEDGFSVRTDRLHAVHPGVGRVDGQFLLHKNDPDDPADICLVPP